MTTLVPFVDLKAQFRALRAEILPRINQVMEDATFVLGPDVAAFEENFAAYAGVDVIVPANTYIASALAVSAVGARPVLVDADSNYLIDPALLDAALTPRTKAIMPVHLYGQVVPMEPIMEFARRHELFVIEDACQAHGARWNGRGAGSFGDVAAFSFYPGKNLGAYGDGGAIVTSDAALAQRLRLMRDFGQRKKYEHLIKGGNCRLDSIQAAVLDVKLRRLDAWNEARRRHAAAYDARLAKIGIKPPVRLAEESHGYHLYAIEVEHRERVATVLRERGIATGIHYPIPIHLQPAYAELGLSRGAFPRTERSAERVLSLPMFPELTGEQIELVADALASAQPLVVA